MFASTLAWRLSEAARACVGLQHAFDGEGSVDNMQLASSQLQSISIPCFSLVHQGMASGPRSNCTARVLLASVLSSTSPSP